MRFVEDIGIEANLWMCLRERGKIISRSIREAHNVFTIVGRNLLSKLISWQTIAGTDIPFTHRRVRWVGVGIGSQLEAQTVTSLAIPTLATPVNFLIPLQVAEFPTTTSVRFIKEFAVNEINITGAPVTVTEAGLFADVNPADTAGGTEDVASNPGTVETIFNPAVGTNSPVAYKSFEGLTKTIDFTLEIRWDFRF